jgi:hypothetical protein
MSLQIHRIVHVLRHCGDGSEDGGVRADPSVAISLGSQPPPVLVSHAVSVGLLVSVIFLAGLGVPTATTPNDTVCGDRIMGIVAASATTEKTTNAAPAMDLVNLEDGQITWQAAWREGWTGAE